MPGGCGVLKTDVDHSAARLAATLTRWGRAAALVVLGVAALDWLGWATGIDELTRVYRTWPRMTPWTALLVAALAVAILAQSGRPSRRAVWLGRGVAVVVGVLAVVFLAEYVTNGSFGLDQMWFSEAVRSLQSSWPGRPSPQTASSVLLLSLAVGLTRLDHPWTRAAWSVGLVLTVGLPFVVVAAYMYEAMSLVGVTPSTGMGISTALALLLLVVATVLARADRNPVAWLVARPDGWALVRMVGILAGLPILVALLRFAFLTSGLGGDASWVLSITVSTVVLGVATFYASQREQRLLIEKEHLSRERAEAEARYRILADNAVDIVEHLRGREIVWISPSVQAAFGDAPHQWVGTDFGDRLHPSDRGALLIAQQRIASGEPTVERFRVRTSDGDYHWVEGRAKPYVAADGAVDGVIAALRIIDDQVEAERHLERLARFDTLTGLVNRAEAIARLESALESPRSPGVHLGVLFCDVDHFKDINDAWGHEVGDVVLTTLADRIRESVRQGDTVGRIGGDEMLVLLPGLHDLDEAAQIAEKIRCRVAEPIHHSGITVEATLSIGATLAAPGEPVSAVTARADVAMYQAKENGRNGVTRI